MSRADDLRAELALLQMEEEFAAAKEAGGVSREDKLALRETRRVFREQRAGSATATPEPVQVAATVENVNGARA